MFGKTNRQLTFFAEQARRWELLSEHRNISDINFFFGMAYAKMFLTIKSIIRNDTTQPNQVTTLFDRLFLGQFKRYSFEMLLQTVFFCFRISKIIMRVQIYSLFGRAFSLLDSFKHRSFFAMSLKTVRHNRPIKQNIKKSVEM